MGQEFLTWSDLATYAMFVSVVFLLVEFCKELKYIKNIPTKYFSAGVAFVLLTLVNLHGGTFELWDIVLYALNAIIISLSANGLAQFNSKKN